MKKEELETRIKGLEGLVESQRETIRELSEKNNNANEELRILKINQNKKETFLFKVYEEDCDYEKNFSMEITENGAKIIVDFIEKFNRNCEYYDISIYKKIK